LKSSKEWRDYIKNNKIPINIPSNPNVVYASDGWEGMGEFLGTGNIKRGSINYLPYKKAQTFAKSLKLKSAKEWRDFAKTTKRPNNIPFGVEKFYKNSGWRDWKHFLGYERNKFLSFNQARKKVQNMNLISSSEYRHLAQTGDLSLDLPKSPDKYYKNSGWLNWNDFLGNNSDKVKWEKFYKYEEAKKIIRPFRVKSSRTWKDFRKSNEFPERIPADPPTFYKEYGWVSWADFLGRE